MDVAVWLECSLNWVSDGDRSTSVLEGALPVLGDRHAVGDVQRHLDGGAGVRDPGARPDRFCAVAGRAFVTSVNTHPRGHSLRGAGQCQRCLQQKGAQG